MAAIYGMADSALRDADAYMTNGERLEAARAAYCGERVRELVRALTVAPLIATIDGDYSLRRGEVVIAHELAAWVRDQAADADATLAEAMFSDIARRRLIGAWAQARAEMEADRLIARGSL